MGTPSVANLVQRRLASALGVLCALSLSCADAALEPADTTIAVAVAPLTDQCATGTCTKWAYPSKFTGRLVYGVDAEGDRIPDFGGVGYEKGASLPNVPTRITIAAHSGVDPMSPCPLPGSLADRTAEIQWMLDNTPPQYPPGTQGAPPGYSGKVVLSAGYFPITGSLSIPSGVVLEGTGDDGTLSGTTIFWCPPAVPESGVDDTRSALSIVGGGLQSSEVVANLTEDVVPVAATSFVVDAPGALAVGETVLVTRTSTADWIDVLHMDEEYMGQKAWGAASTFIFERRVMRKEGQRVFIDEPLTTAIERNNSIVPWSAMLPDGGVPPDAGSPPDGGVVPAVTYATGTVRHITGNYRTNHSGLANLRIIDAPAMDGTLLGRRRAIFAKGAEHIYISGVSAVGFGSALVQLDDSVVRATVVNSKYLSPTGPRVPMYRYSFTNEGQLNLFKECYAQSARHDYVMNKRAVGPNVMHDSVSESGSAEIGPHQRWGTGTLFDNIDIIGVNQGSLYESAFAGFVGGTNDGHGWRGANMVFWSCTGGIFRVQNPPTAQNWVIGGSEGLSSVNDLWSYSLWEFPRPYDLAPPLAYADRIEQAVTPQSLYVTQAAERKVNTFTWDGPVGGSWGTDQNWLPRVVPSRRRAEGSPHNSS